MRGHRRSRDVRRVARLVAGPRRHRGDARRPVRARRRARHVGRRVAPDPLRPRAGCLLHRVGAPGAHAVARAGGRVRRGRCSSSAASSGSPTPRTASRRATMATFDAQGIPYERLAPEAGARAVPELRPRRPRVPAARARGGRAARPARGPGARAPGGGARRHGAARQGGARRRAGARSTTAACWRATPSSGRAGHGSAACSPSSSRSARRGRSCSSSTAARRGRADGVPAYVDFDRAIYGTRDLDGLGVKAAPDFDGPPLDPDAALPAASREGEALARAFLAERFPALADAPLSGSKCCRYELTPDAHFVAAPHPGARVRLAARRRLGPRLQARPGDGRARRRGARRRRAAARELRARRPRRRAASCAPLARRCAAA